MSTMIWSRDENIGSLSSIERKKCLQWKYNWKRDYVGGDNNGNTIDKEIMGSMQEG